MNYRKGEVIIEETATSDVPADELAAMALELRALWHAIVRGSECSPHHDRQQFWVLGALESGSRRMSDLAERTLTSQASLTGIVDRLEERGLVERVRSIEDRRVVAVSLTEAGTAELCRARAGFVLGLEGVIEPLSAEERAAFLGLLRKLTERMPDTRSGAR